MDVADGDGWCRSARGGVPYLGKVNHCTDWLHKCILATNIALLSSIARFTSLMPVNTGMCCMDLVFLLTPTMDVCKMDTAAGHAIVSCEPCTCESCDWKAMGPVQKHLGMLLSNTWEKMLENDCASVSCPFVLHWLLLSGRKKWKGCIHTFPATYMEDKVGSRRGMWQIDGAEWCRFARGGVPCLGNVTHCTDWHHKCIPATSSCCPALSVLLHWCLWTLSCVVWIWCSC